jgi:hypothetical protein
MPLTDASTDAVTPFLISAASYYLMHTTLVESHTQQIPTLTHSLTHTHSYMLLELLKNSMRATVELHGVDNMPPIRIIIADGEDNEDVSRSQLNVHR